MNLVVSILIGLGDRRYGRTAMSDQYLRYGWPATGVHGSGEF
jgi:hypothetical protein